MRQDILGVATTTFHILPHQEIWGHTGVNHAMKISAECCSLS